METQDLHVLLHLSSVNNDLELTIMIYNFINMI